MRGCLQYATVNLHRRRMFVGDTLVFVHVFIFLRKNEERDHPIRIRIKDQVGGCSPLQRCGHASCVGSMTVRDGRRQWKRCDLAKAAVQRLWSPSSLAGHVAQDGSRCGFSCPACARCANRRFTSSLVCLFACSPPLPGLVLRLWLWMFAFRMGRARCRGRLTIA